MALVFPAAANAAATVGETFPATISCGGGITRFQLSSPGNQYAMPFDGVVTAWSIQQTSEYSVLKLKIVRPVGGMSFQVVGSSSLELLTPNALNSFGTRVPVRGGDLLGEFQPPTGFVACERTVSGYVVAGGPTTDPDDGSVFAQSGTSANAQLELSVALEHDADNDGYGDETQDCAPDDGSRHDDCAPPETTIIRGPKAKTKKKSASFEFASSEPASTFECSLNGAPFTPCSSPDEVKSKKGKNHFEVRAKDAVGNVDGSPASADWKVTKKKKKK